MAPRPSAPLVPYADIRLTDVELAAAGQGGLTARSRPLSDASMKAFISIPVVWILSSTGTRFRRVWSGCRNPAAHRQAQPQSRRERKRSLVLATALLRDADRSLRVRVMMWLVKRFRSDRPDVAVSEGCWSTLCLPAVR